MTADRVRGALAVLQDADGKFLCEVPCGYIVEPTASAYHIRLNVTIKMATPYKECPLCGAHLDNGERCDCTENLNGDNSPKENKSYEGAKNNDRN